MAQKPNPNISFTPASGRKQYQTDVDDDEWSFVAPYLTLMKEDAPQRKYEMRELFNALRWIVRAGSPWRLLPNHFPPWETVYNQTQRWIKAGCFEAMVHDLRELLRNAAGKSSRPSAAIFDSRTLQSTPESGGEGRAGYDGAKKKKGSKLHMAVDTLGNLLALLVAPADEQDRAKVDALCEKVQGATQESVEVGYVDQGYTGENAEAQALAWGIKLMVVKFPEAKNGFVLLPKRWVVERSFAWAARFRRLAKDYERLPETVAGLHFAVFAILMLAKAVALIQST